MKVSQLIIFTFGIFILIGCDGFFHIENNYEESTHEMNFSSTPVAVNTQTNFFVTPRWIPDGSGFLVSGKFGTGLYLLKLRDLNVTSLEEIDATYRGQIQWVEEGKSFCMNDSGNYLKYDISLGKLQTDTEGICGNQDHVFVSVQEKAIYNVLYEDERGEIIHDKYRGGIKIRAGDGDLIVEESPAWNVKVSPDGNAIAFCSGPLTDSTLKIYDRDSGENTIVKGVHPSWFPDGRFVIYASPISEETAQGKIEIVASDLFAFDTQSNSAIRLTETPDIIEMQPAVSPDGSRVLFSDWKSGLTYVTSVGREVEP